MLKYSDLISSLKQRKVLPLYLFYGEEEFLIQEALDRIIAVTVDPGARDFNFNVFYCRDTPASEVVAAAQALPFLSEKRLVIAKDIDAFKTADLDTLVQYLNDPSPSSCLVMVSNQGRYDKKAVVAGVEAHGAAVRFYPLLDRELTGWIEAWCRARELSIQRDAAQYLCQILGNDLRKIANELQKVEIFIKERKSITYNDVKSVAGDFRDYTPFDLAAALGQKNREKALLILSRLLQEGEAPVGLLGSVAWNFRRLLQAKTMEAAGAAPDEVMKKLRPPVIFHQTGLFRDQMKRYSMDELQRTFTVLLSADRDLKSGGLNGRLVLERMILKLCGAAEAGA